MKEDISVNVKENYVIYHVNDDDTDVSVLQDFNRVITLNHSIIELLLCLYVCTAAAAAVVVV